MFHVPFLPSKMHVGETTENGRIMHRKKRNIWHANLVPKFFAHTVQMYAKMSWWKKIDSPLPFRHHFFLENKSRVAFEDLPLHKEVAALIGLGNKGSEGGVINFDHSSGIRKTWVGGASSSSSSSSFFPIKHLPEKVVSTEMVHESSFEFGKILPRLRFFKKKSARMHMQWFFSKTASVTKKYGLRQKTF